MTSGNGSESAFGGRSSDSGDRILRSPEGLLIELLRGTPEGDEAEVLGAAIDRLVAWDRGQESGGWVTSVRPGIGLRAWTPGSRWNQSLRASWGAEP